MDIEGVNEQCVLFSQPNAGSTFRAIGCSFNTSATAGTLAAVAVGTIDTEATSRHFTNCESGGCTLYDFGGANDLYVTGGYTNGLMFSSSAASKVMINNLRIGAAAGTITIRGGNHQIENCVFAADVINDSNNLRFRCEVPSYNITDNSSGSTIEFPFKSFDTAWTQSSGTQPSLGNGTLSMYYSRQGFTATVNFRLVIGSTTTTGNSGAAYRFSLPFKGANVTQNYTGGQIIDATSASTNYIAQIQIGAGESTFTMSCNGTSVRDGSPLTWADGDVISATFTYFVW